MTDSSKWAISYYFVNFLFTKIRIVTSDMFPEFPSNHESQLVIFNLKANKKYVNIKK